MQILKEFREFAVKGNVIDLAVGVVIGGAFGKIVNALVDQVIMPPIGLLTGGIDCSAFKLVLKHATDGKPEVAIGQGLFLNVVLQFAIVASYAPEDGEAMARHRADMEAHRPFRDFTYTLIGQDGSRVSICTSGKPIFADDGTFLGYRGTSSDITQLRAAKALLDQRTRALEEAHRLGKIGTWSYRLDTGRTIWAPELYQLLGFDPDAFEPTDESMRPYFLDGDADRFKDLQRRVVRTRRTEATDLRILHADGAARDLAVICKAEVAHDKVIGIIGTVQDVTERKEAERQLEQLAYTDPLATGA